MAEIGAIGREIARHPDGSIDFEVYRARAVALRRQASQETAKLKPVHVVALALLAALAIAVLVTGPVVAPGSHVAVAADAARIR